MRVAISGSKGFVGSHLVHELKTNYAANIIHIPRALLYGNTEELSAFITDCDVIIHLSGAPIICRWTPKNKKELYDSRVITTQNLVHAIASIDNKPKVFISTSAVGIYDSIHSHSEFSTEYSDDYLGKICIDWEKAAYECDRLGIRTVIFRLGVILSDKGGAMQKALPVFKLGLGGKLGDGMQAFPYIHMKDLINAYLHVIENVESCGVYNAVAPEIVSNKTYTKSLGMALNRPTFFAVPSFLLNLLLGESAQMLLKGQQVRPKRLLLEGFIFQFASIQMAISSFFIRRS